MADIAVLLPSRKRVASLIDSVASLANKALRWDQVEILVAADPDDPKTAEYAEKLPNTSCWIAPERYGYGRLNEYFNRLAATNRFAEWYLLWNDDARMETLAWDQILRDLPAQTLVADLQVDQHSPDLCTFPAVRGCAVWAIGDFSPVTCHCDTWWQDIGRMLEAITPVPIKVDHQRFDLSGKHGDQTWIDGQAQYRSQEYYGPVVQQALFEAAMKIREVCRG